MKENGLIWKKMVKGNSLGKIQAIMMVILFKIKRKDKES